MKSSVLFPVGPRSSFVWFFLIWVILQFCDEIEGDTARKRKGKCNREVVKMTDQNGTFQTPLFPRKYRNRQTCIWYIEVKSGYRVKLRINYKKGFGIGEERQNCLTGDSLIISSRRQSFERYRSKSYVIGPHSLIICGRKAPNKVIVSPDRNLWLRFRADPTKDANQIGFRAKYVAVDVNECINRGGCDHACVNTPGSYHCTCRFGYELGRDKKSCIDIDDCRMGPSYHSCSHICENLQGTYRCACPYGMNLDRSGKRCTGDITYQIAFDKEVFTGTVDANSPVGTKILNVSGNAVGSNGTVAKKDLEYEIISENNKTAQPLGTFEIDKKTGIIRTKKLIHDKKIRQYYLIVEAQLDAWTRDKTIVRIFVNRSENAVSKGNNDFSFTVLVHQGLKRGDNIFDLKNHYYNAYTSFRFSMREQNSYFAVRESSGLVYVYNPLPRLAVSRGLLRQTISINVQRIVNSNQLPPWKCTIIVIILPTYPGEGYLTPDIMNAVGREISEETGTLDGRARFSSRKKGQRAGALGLHRLFRRPSPQARKLSEAKLFFDKVLEKVEHKVKQAFGGRDRSGPIILNLGTGQIVSPESLSDIVKASKCHEALNVPSCIDHRFHGRYRTFDGTCNNIDNPLWGAAPVAFRRLLPAKYYDIDGLSDPIGFPNLPEAPDLPSPHQISEQFFILEKTSEAKSGDFSHMLMQWGQFIDHDLTFTAESEGGHHCILSKCDGSAADFTQPCFPIMYPDTVGECSLFIRSAAACQTTSNLIESRQQLNTITAYLDGSMVYGSSKAEAQRLRNQDDTGTLKTGPNNLLPFINFGKDLKPPLSFCLEFGGCFAAGDVRSNEQVALASIHTLWVREHNRIARTLRHYNRHWDGEKIYQEARKIVGAQIQHITYKEYLPKILGNNALPPYTGYKTNVDATIANVFATAAFRFGHSLVRPTFSQLNANYDPVAPELPIVHAFFNNSLLIKHGIERFLLGMIGNFSQKVDRKLAFGIAKQLFQRPGAQHGFNIAALNLQRGRDHGLPGYGHWRRHCNLSNAYIFEKTAREIRDPQARNILRRLYRNRVEHADLFVSGLAEDPVPGALVGPTFHCLIKDQFKRLRDGDRFYYENDNVFTSEQLQEIKRTSLSKVMCDNLKGLVSIQRDAFKAFKKFSYRVSCAGIRGMDLSAWRENHFISDRRYVGEWSSWVNTVRLSTGTWATIIGKKICGNESITDIECQTMDGMPYTNAGENTVCDQRFGVYCRDNEQVKAETKCSRYRFRMRCADIPTRTPDPPEAPTGIPKDKRPSSMNCTKGKVYMRTREGEAPFPDKLYLKQSGLGVIVFNTNDFAMVFPSTEEAVLYDPYTVTPKNEYLLIGKDQRGYKKRALIKFNLNGLKRYDIVHSAKLQLYFVGQQIHKSLNVLARFNRPTVTLEAYIVNSTDWTSENVTSRMPWHGDHLKIGKDVDGVKLSSAKIPADRAGWIELDIYRAVYQWRVSVALRRPNYGLLIRVADDNYPVGVFQFASKEHQNESIRPRLLICMTAHSWR